MRYRILSATGDYVFGSHSQFLVNSPQAVAQAIETRLKLSSGEWFLDTQEGTPYSTKITGYGTQDTRDVAIKERILDTPGVLQIESYASSVSSDRKFTVSVRVSTIYGTVDVVVRPFDPVVSP
jgi:hypothetical protein